MSFHVSLVLLPLCYPAQSLARSYYFLPISVEMSDQQKEIVRQLHRVFGDKDITESVIQTLFIENDNNVEAVVDALLNLSKDADKNSASAKSNEVRPCVS